MSLDIRRILESLVARRPIFHSEADFQHALAWEITRQYGAAEMRLEVRPFPGEAMALDLLVQLESRTTAIELKHRTRALDVTVGGERFVLKNQAAHPIASYDCCKDLARLEWFVRAGVSDCGFLVILKNDQLF